MKFRWFAYILFLFLLAPQSALTGENYKYKVVSVLDGDTFIATDGNIKFRVRIAAMDAPEMELGVRPVKFNLWSDP